MFFRRCVVKKGSSIARSTRCSCHINHLDPVRSIQTRPACRYEELQRISFRRIVLHLAHFNPTWAEVEAVGVCKAGSHGADGCETGYSRVSKNSPASPPCATAQATSMRTLSIRRGCQSRFSGRDGICFIFTRTSSPC